MVTPELIEYVKSSLSAGQNPEALKSTLQSNGWSHDDVEAAVNQIMSREPVIEAPTSSKFHISKKTGIFTGFAVLLVAGVALAAFYLLPASPEKVVKNASLKFSTVNSFDYSGSIVADITAPSGLFGMDTILHGITKQNSDSRIAGTSNTKFSINFQGTADVTDLEHPKSDLSLNFNYTLLTFGLQLRLIDKTLYLKFNQLPKVPGFDLSEYADTWVKIDPEAIAKEYGVGIDFAEGQPDLTQGQKKQLKDLTAQAHFFSSFTKLADDAIDNATMYHYALQVDKAGFKNYLTQIDKINNAAGSSSANLGPIFDTLQFNNFEVWISKKDGMIYRISGQVSELPQPGMSQQASGSVNVLFNFKNYNHPSPILVPTDTKNLQDVIADLTASTQIKTRDARRMADVRQITTGLELYYNDRGAYPSSLNNLKPTYLAVIPTAPQADGSCSIADNTYTYRRLNSTQYNLSFCLGQDAGSYSAGIHAADPTGIK